MSPTPPSPAADTAPDAEGDDAAMLSAMGFSSFVSGPISTSASQPRPHANKKRKTGNPAASLGAGPAGRSGKNLPDRLHGEERHRVVEKEEEGIEGDGRTHAERQSAIGMEKGGKGEGEGGGYGGYTWSQWRTGVRVENGDVAFYDESFVEDPWEGLRDRGEG
ncbi:MAG: hypothetical protein LQ342_001848 [Letrouitia transgressa]|nr:MAG: hypothetical protein LQ342_001848 [Letrouitia transgressa]